MTTSILLALFLATTTAHADENIRPAKELVSLGYQAVVTSRSLRDSLPAAHSLSWPVQFQDSSHSIGNSMAEFQPFGSPYFHGGCDLRTQANADIHAPVSGKLEAGHYGYDNNPDGSLTKYWMAWPQQGDATYFEVAVITDDGTRYEFHHVNRRTLPQPIVAMLNAGGGRVDAGTLLGHVIPWPGGDYHHTHYNIVLPSGTRVNPEFASPLLADTLAPEILGTFALSDGGKVSDFGNGRFTASSGVKEFVVDVVDRQNGNVYEHPPVYARLKFESGAETLWDFRATLTSTRGTFPPLFDFLMESLRTPGGTRETEGGYGTGHSLIRLAVPAGANGAFTIEMGDIAGNLTTRAGTISP